MEFKDYGFKPADVIKGLNLYYSRKDPRYLHIKKAEHSYWHLLDEEVTSAINWLREEHNIFYTPGMKVEDDDKDIFDTPRYRFLSILSAELGFRTIVGPGNAEKTEDAIMRAVKCRNDELKNFRSQQIDEEGEAEARKEFLRKLRCELGVPMPVVKGSREEMEEDILERIGKLKEGNWPCENGNTFAEYMKKQFPKECAKWHVRPLKEGSVHDWIQYIFGELDGWRNRAINAEEERDRALSDRGKFKAMLNTMYGASCGDTALPCYRDTCSNSKAIKERDAAICALFELRAKIRDVYREVFNCEFEANYDYTSALDDILGEFKFQKELKETAEAKTVAYKTELNKCREYILTVYREIFDCSNGDPEGNDKEDLEDILDEYRRVTKCFETKFAECENLKRRLHAERAMCDHLRNEHSRQCSSREEFLRKLCKEFNIDFDKRSNYLPEMENAILNSVKTLSESFDGANGELEEMTVELNELRKTYDTVVELYNAATKLLGEYLKDAKDILGIDSCDKDTVASAIRALKSAYDSLRNDHDEVCEGYTKLKKDYDELGEAYRSVLKRKNSDDMEAWRTGGVE